MIPATFVDSSDWGIPEGLMLTDENFNKPNSIDILLKFCAMIRRRDQEIIQFYRIQIVSGKIPLAVPEEVPRKSFFICNSDTLDQLLQRFWKIEELPNKTWTAEEILCEEHFKKHTA